MNNLKIRVANEAESKEAQELFFELGAKWRSQLNRSGEALIINTGYPSIFLYASEMSLNWRTIIRFKEDTEFKEITIPQLKDLVVLKRNDVSDKNVIDPYYNASLYLDSKGDLFVFHIPTKTWKESSLNGYDQTMQRLKPIAKVINCTFDEKPIRAVTKEYLDPRNGYKLIEAPESEALEPHASKWIEIPKGAEVALSGGSGSFCFYKNNDSYFNGLEWRKCDVDSIKTVSAYVDTGAMILWQRHEQPEEPPINYFEDADAFIESNVEQDNVNHPSHYSSGEVECIDAIQSSMTHEAFCGYLKGNVQKYMWRYENKGGTESLKKAQWYLNKLIEVRDENSSED